MICSSVDVIVQAQRLRDGSRRITHVTEVMGMEGDSSSRRTSFSTTSSVKTRAGS
jgi:Flp pilus assembly CpaF family ATPase